MNEFVMVSGWFCIGSIGAILAAGFLGGVLLTLLDNRISRSDGH